MNVIPFDGIHRSGESLYRGLLEGQWFLGDSWGRMRLLDRLAARDCLLLIRVGYVKRLFGEHV